LTPDVSTPSASTCSCVGATACSMCRAREPFSFGPSAVDNVGEGGVRAVASDIVSFSSTVSGKQGSVQGRPGLVREPLVLYELDDGVDSGPSKRGKRGSGVIQAP
jgi:hypothetical protein